MENSFEKLLGDIAEASDRFTPEFTLETMKQRGASGTREFLVPKINGWACGTIPTLDWNDYVSQAIRRAYELGWRQGTDAHVSLANPWCTGTDFKKAKNHE